MPYELNAAAVRHPLPGQRRFDWLERDLAAMRRDNPVPPQDSWPWIPELDLAMQAEEVPAPVIAWGSRAHSIPNPGTFHFYVDDRRFLGLWKKPEKIPASGCRVAFEVNYSTFADTRKMGVLWTIYRKRILASYWQQCGVKILVDLNVNSEHRDLALVGVPRGWRAYAARVHVRGHFRDIERDYEQAREHAGTDDILFVVVGGGKRARRNCSRRGWPHIPEHIDAVHGRLAAYGI